MTSQQAICDALETRALRAPLRSYAVGKDLVLAGQPQPEDWRQLAAQGFRTVVNIRSDPERAAAQRASAEEAGLHYVYAPLPAYLLEAEHLAEFARIVERPEIRPLFVHCRSATRVALMWMLYRIVHQGWTQAEAEAELRAAGYDEDSMETFEFCAADFFERTGLTGGDSGRQRPSSS